MSWHLPDLPFNFDVDYMDIRSENYQGFDVHKVTFRDSFWHLLTVFGTSDESVDELSEDIKDVVEHFVGSVNNDSTKTVWINFTTYSDADTDDESALRVDVLYLPYG